MGYQSKEGILLRRKSYFDTDQLVEFFTPDHGVLSVRVPYGQKSQKTHCGRLEPPNLLQARLYQSREDGPWTLSESEVVTVYADLMTEEDICQELWPLLSLYSDLYPEGQPPGDSYRRFRKGLDLLKQGFRPALLIANRLLIKSLEESGVALQLQACSRCGNERSDRWTVSPEIGLLCENCSVSEAVGYDLSFSTREALLHLSQEQWREVTSESYARTDLEKAEVLLYRLLHFHFEISLETLKVRQSL